MEACVKIFYLYAHTESTKKFSRAVLHLSETEKLQLCRHNIPTTLIQFDVYKNYTFSLYSTSYSLVVFVTLTKDRTMLDW